MTPSLLSFLADTVFSPLRRAAALSIRHPVHGFMHGVLCRRWRFVHHANESVSVYLCAGLQQLSSAVMRRLPPPATVQGVLHVVHVRLRRDWVVPLRLTSVRLPLTE